MGDKTLVYKTIGSARTKADREDIDSIPIRDFMPLPYEGIVDLVSRLGADDTNLDEYVRELNEQYWSENLKNVTMKPAERKDAQFMQQNYQWECRRLAGFTRQEKTKKPKANFGTLENIYSVVQRLPPEIWNALTGSEEDLTDKAPEELGIIHRDALDKSDWKSNLQVLTDKIVWTFTKDGTEDFTRTQIPTSPIDASAAKSPVKTGKNVGISIDLLEIRKFGAYLGKAENVAGPFRALSSYIKSPTFSMSMFPSQIVGDDFALIGGVEVTDKYTTEIVVCLQYLLNLFKSKGYAVTTKRPDMTESELVSVFRGKKYGNDYQNILSKNAIDVFSGKISSEDTGEEDDERERVYGKFLWVTKGNKVAGLCWIKEYEETKWGQWFQRSFHNSKGPSPPFSEDPAIKEEIYNHLFAKDSLYFEVCYMEDRRLAHALNLIAMILYGSTKESVVSNIAPDLPSVDGGYLLPDDDYGPRLVPDHQTLLMHETLLGYQKSFDLRYNVTPDNEGDPSPKLEDLYGIKSKLPESFLYPPPYSLLPILKESSKGLIPETNVQLVDMLWDKDLMLYNTMWNGTQAKNDKNAIRSLEKLVYNEIEAQNYTGGNVKSGKGEYQLYDIDPVTEAYQVKNDGDYASSKKKTQEIINRNGFYKQATRHRNGTLSPRLFHYEMFRFLPNLKEIRTICGLLGVQEKTARSLRGGSVVSESSRVSDMDILMDRLRGGIEPIVEMDMDIDVSAGLELETF